MREINGVAGRMRGEAEQVELDPQQNKAFNQEDDDDDGSCCFSVDFEEEEEDAIFKPSIKIRKIDDDAIHISTIVMKEVSLTSTLFSVLEEENLDIVFEDHYRTETKAAHSIQVRVQPGYNVEALETKLRSWALGQWHHGRS